VEISCHGQQVTPAIFTRRDLAYQIGVAPVRIDILTGITGVDSQQTPGQVGRGGSIFGVPVHFNPLHELISKKQATGAGSDLEQLEPLFQKWGFILEFRRPLFRAGESAGLG
jgi:hypothetical protein